MAVTRDILESWLRPRKVVARLLAKPTSEPFALSLLLTFLTLALVATLPVLARQNYLDGGTAPLSPRVLASALGLLATVPVFYLMAALAVVAARVFGMGLSQYQGRIALFWAALATTPAMLLQSLVQGLVGSGPAVTVLGMIVGAIFLVFWGLGLRTAGRG